MAKLEKIIAEFPYNAEYSHGYISINKDGRRIIQLVNSDYSKRKTIAFARYRLSVLNKRFLTENEEADHKNDDFTDDSDNNLQILSRAQNLLKQCVKQRKPLVICKCPNCLKSFGILPSEYKFRKQKATADIFCSRSCSSQWNIRTGLSPSISERDNFKVPIDELIKLFKLLNKGKNNKELAEELRISVGAVKHRRSLLKNWHDEGQA